MNKTKRDPAPAQTAMRLAWQSVADMPGYVSGNVFEQQPADIQRAWVAFVQSQTIESMRAEQAQTP